MLQCPSCGVTWVHVQHNDCSAWFTLKPSEVVFHGLHNAPGESID